MSQAIRSHTRAHPKSTHKPVQGFGSLTAAPSSAATTMTSEAPKPAPDARLAAVRRHMASVDGKRGLSAFIVPTEDPHSSEYSPACFTRRQYISK